MGRVIKRALLVVAVFALFVLLIIPARAESEPWVLWSSFDCNDWTSGCQDGLIHAGEAGTSIFVNATCGVAEIILERGPQSDSVVVQIADRIFLLGDRINSFRFMNFQQGTLTLSDSGFDGQLVYGVVIECYDPRPASFYGVPGEIEPGDLETMSDAGTDILRSAATTILPMIIGLAVGMGIVVTILRMTRWL